MTAEVAILNKHGLAMAADSAVTTPGAKIFNTVNKLFALSKIEPVGVMVYSNAFLMGVPVETAVKEFRRLLGDTSNPHLEDYAEAFDNFLKTDERLFPQSARIHCCEQTVGLLYSSVQTQAFQQLFTEKPVWGHPSEQEARDVAHSIIDRIAKEIQERPQLAGQNVAAARPLFQQALRNSLENMDKWLASVLPIDGSHRKVLTEVAVEQFFREGSTPGETGIVVAGYGAEDIFPRLRAWEFQCSLFGIHRTRPVDKVQISDSHPAEMSAFAQKDMVDTFLLGRDRRIDGFLLSFIDEFFEEQAKRLDAEQTLPEAQRLEAAAASRQLGKALVEQARKHLQRVTTEFYIHPTLSVISAMPKEELALLAESLISLTSLKRKASNESETVGGPTDVAVISKGDGFIWIKRKHYFDPKLNQTFGLKYLREIVQ